MVCVYVKSSLHIDTSALHIDGYICYRTHMNVPNSFYIIVLYSFLKLTNAQYYYALYLSF